MAPRMNSKRALIAGVTGAIGSALAAELASRDDWAVEGLSRRASFAPIKGVNYHPIDLDDYDKARGQLAELPPVTHVFYCGRVTHAEQVIEDPAANLRLLAHLIEALEAGRHALQHVDLVQGGKVYGVHLGPFPTPAAEDDPRPDIENFNFDHQDYLESRVQTAQWSWSASRPNTLMHFSAEIGRNLVSSIGCYAMICREQGIALDFPGAEGAWQSQTQLTTLSLLARGIAWITTQPRCADLAFNFTNTDVIRWSDLWPRIADYFDMPCGVVRPQCLAETMPAQSELWARIAKQHGLRFKQMQQVSNWGYLDATLERYWDELFSHQRAFNLGFRETDDSYARFNTLLGEYCEAGILR